MQGDDVKVVGRFVKHQEIGIAHQHGAKVQPPALATGEFAHIGILAVGGKEKMLQELRCRQVAAAAEINILGYVAHDVDDLGVFAKLQALLRVVAEAHGLAHGETAGVGFFQSHQQFDEGGLARAVVANDTHLLVAREGVEEIFQDNLVGPEGFGDIVGLEYLVTDVGTLQFQARALLLNALMGALLQLVEGLLAVAGLVAAGRRGAAHPFQFAPVEVVGPLYFAVAGIDALLAFLEVVAVIAVVNVELARVKLHNLIADTVEEIAVVGDHQQSERRRLQKLLQPLYHVQVEVIGRLVEHQQVGLHHEHAGQGDTLHLSARKRSHTGVEVVNLQFRQDLFHTRLVVPCLSLVHALHQLLQPGIAGRGQTVFIGLDQLGRRVGMLKTGLHHRQFRREGRMLRQIAHTQVTAEDYLAVVIVLIAAYYIKERGLARPVLGDKARALPFGHAERHVRKEHQVADGFRQTLDIENGCCHNWRESKKKSRLPRPCHPTFSLSGRPRRPKEQPPGRTQIGFRRA